MIRNIFYIIVAMYLIILSMRSVHQLGLIITLRTGNATQAQRITELEERFDNYPFDHSKFETDINLIGGKVFENWEMASERYAKRGE
jgi:hypothetical protein